MIFRRFASPPGSHALCLLPGTPPLLLQAIADPHRQLPLLHGLLGRLRGPGTTRSAARQFVLSSFNLFRETRTSTIELFLRNL